MDSYCRACKRKVTTRKHPTSCDCYCGGDGYCHTCIAEYKNGKKCTFFESQKIFYIQDDTTGEFVEFKESLYKKIVEENCPSCYTKLEFE